MNLKRRKNREINKIKSHSFVKSNQIDRLLARREETNYSTGSKLDSIILQALQTSK
jgi:hypothetical protein